jgi:SEC-C motif
MRLGRNELCHCGSGRKYKKCCLTLGGSSDIGRQSGNETNLQILHRAVPPTIIQEVMDEIEGSPFDRFQALTQELLDRHPRLIAFVVGNVAYMREAIRHQSLLMVVSVIRMFEKCYGLKREPIAASNVESALRRNMNLILQTLAGNWSKQPGDVVQPFIVKFLGDALTDFQNDERPDERETAYLLAIFKTVVDVLDRAYALGGDRHSLANA